MASEFIASINFAMKQISIYYGIPVFVLGVTGAFLNIIVFLSLKTFRESPCGFYLVAMSVFDLSRFFLSTLGTITNFGFGIDWGVISLVYCKMRIAVTTFCLLGSMTCLCLAVIDQYLATSSHPRWQQLSSIKLAHRLVAMVPLIWIGHSIPYVIFYNHIPAPVTSQVSCQITNSYFIQYHTYGFFFTLSNLLPVISVIFGLMAFHNARNLAYRAVPLLRRELDKQLTVMVLVQVLVNFCTFLPYSVTSMYSLSMPNRSDTIFQTKVRMASISTLHFSMLSYAVRILFPICFVILFLLT